MAKEKPVGLVEGWKMTDYFSREKKTEKRIHFFVSVIYCSCSLLFVKNDTNKMALFFRFVFFFVVFFFCWWTSVRVPVVVKVNNVSSKGLLNHMNIDRCDERYWNKQIIFKYAMKYYIWRTEQNNNKKEYRDENAIEKEAAFRGFHSLGIRFICSNIDDCNLFEREFFSPPPNAYLMTLLWSNELIVIYFFSSFF